MASKPSVLIVGAGPSGLTLATVLQRYDIPVRIIDKNIKPVKTSNALAVQTRTLNIWEQLGILDQALAAGQKIKDAYFYAGKRKMAAIDTQLLRSTKKYLLTLPQHDTEAILIDHLHSKNIPVEMETELLDLQMLNHSVQVTLQGKNHAQEKLIVDWLIACDGAHSTIRHQLNLEFAGRKLAQHFVLADAEIETDLATDSIHGFPSPHGVFFVIPFKINCRIYWRIIADVTGDPQLATAKSLSYEQVKKLAAERCSFPLKISNPLWTSGFSVHERMIKQFRVGPVFFVGDAAHIHSPAGGQGMNTGIQDAYNLGWKLAWVMQKKADSRILDTYDLERKPVAREVLRATTALTRIMTVKNPLLISLRNLLIEIAAQFKFIRRRMINTVGDLTIHYAPNLMVQECLPHQSGPAAGAAVEGINGLNMHLLLFTGMDGTKDFQWAQDLKDRYSSAWIKCTLISIHNDFSRWQGHYIFDENKSLHQAYGATQPRIYLIRPDQHVGFRGTIKDIPQLERYLKYFQ